MEKPTICFHWNDRRRSHVLTAPCCISLIISCYWLFFVEYVSFLWMFTTLWRHKSPLLTQRMRVSPLHSFGYLLPEEEVVLTAVNTDLVSPWVSRGIKHADLFVFSQTSVILIKRWPCLFHWFAEDLELRWLHDGNKLTESRNGNEDSSVWTRHFSEHVSMEMRVKCIPVAFIPLHITSSSYWNSRVVTQHSGKRGNFERIHEQISP